MKRNSLLPLLTLGTCFALTFTGCSKDDTTAPIITLIGSANIDLPLNNGGSAWTDLSATAADDEDGTVIVTSDASSSKPDVNKSGTYTITYTSTDKAGNVGIETRTIQVYNEAEIFAGAYNNSVDTCVATGPSAFNATVVLSDSINRLVKIQNFGALSADIWVTITGNSTGSSITLATGQSLGGNAQINSAYPSDSKVISGNSTSTSFTIK